MAAEIITENAQIVKALKNVLQSHNVLDKRHKIAKIGPKFHIRSVSSPEEIRKILSEYIDQVSISGVEETSSPAIDDQSLTGLVMQYFDQHSSPQELNHPLATFLEKLPKKWSTYPPMVLFNTGTFDSDIWTNVFETHIDRSEFLSFIARAFPGKITHFAINKPIIEEDEMRRPFNLVPLSGDFGPEPTETLFCSPSPADLENAFWCSVIQNGIHQTWAPRYTMFSRGNIKEKKRVLDTFRDLNGKAVIDLYAGIGYFTLSYLANGATVFCWEINPWSIEGLIRGLQKNGYKYKLFRRTDNVAEHDLNNFIAQGIRAFVFHESNEYAPERLANMGVVEISHINLGLLPSSKPSWPMVRAATAAAKERTMVHVHENVHKDKFTELRQEISEFFDGRVTHLEKVKTFAPDVWHVVVDVLLHTSQNDKN